MSGGGAESQNCTCSPDSCENARGIVTHDTQGVDEGSKVIAWACPGREATS